MPSGWPPKGRKCYVTPAFSGVPNKDNNKAERNQNWLPQSWLLGSPKVGASATSSLHSRGSPTKGSKIRIGCLSHAFSGAQKWAEVLCHPCIQGGPQQRGTKSERAASTMPSRGPKSGRNYYITPAFPEVPSQAEQNQNLLPQPCLLGGPKGGGSAMPPLHSWGSPTKGSKIRIGCLSHAFSGAQKSAQVQHYPCILVGSQQRRAKSEVPASAMPSQGPKGGRKCYVSTVLSGVPNKGQQNQNLPHQPCPIGGPKVGGSASPPLHFRGSPTKTATKQNEIRLGCLSHALLGAISGRMCYVIPASTWVPNKGQQNQNWLPEPCLLTGPKGGRKCYVSPAFSGVPSKKGSKTKIGCLSHAFARAQKWAEVLYHPCVLGGPQQRGAKLELAASAMPSRWPKSGRKCYVTLALWGFPNKDNNKAERNQNWLPQSCLLGGP